MPSSAFLARLMQRSPLGQEAQDAIHALRGRVCQAEANTDIVAMGETVDHACLVVHGLTARFDEGNGGRRALTALHVGGDMCDLHSIYSPKTAFGIAALCTTTYLRVPHAQLRRLVESYPAIALAFWTDGHADGSMAAKWIAILGRRKARSRIAHLFCEMGLRLEKADLGTRASFMFNASQDQLAAATGLTSIHLNRVLQELRAEGVVSTHGRQITIPDWDSLCAVAAFDPAYLLYAQH